MEQPSSGSIEELKAHHHMRNQQPPQATTREKMRSSQKPEESAAKFCKEPTSRNQLIINAQAKFVRRGPRTTTSFMNSVIFLALLTSISHLLILLQILPNGIAAFPNPQARQQDQDQNGFQLHDLYTLNLHEQQQQQQDQSRKPSDLLQVEGGNQTLRSGNNTLECPNGLLTFELSTGFIFKPTSAADTLSMMPSTLQLTDCLDYCLHNSSCLAINFEMGLCVLLATSAKQNQHSLYSSQFPVFTIYAEKKCLLKEPGHVKHRRRCQRAWTFERVAGYEMKVKPRRRLKLGSKELCMDACLVEQEFECRSANWYRQTGECTLSDQDRHSVSQSEAGDQQIKASLSDFYGPANSSLSSPATDEQPNSLGQNANHHLSYQNFYSANSLAALPHDRSRLQGQLDPTSKLTAKATVPGPPTRPFRQLYTPKVSAAGNGNGRTSRDSQPAGGWPMTQMMSQHHYIDLPANTQVDYLENNCIYEPNKLCEFRKIQNKVLKTVDSIYQDVASLDECRQKCLNAPYRCYSFDYGDTSERVCRTSHLDQASLLSVNEPYLEVVGSITYELAACFNVSIQCRAKEMVALVSSSKTFNGKIYAKSRPSSCVNDVKDSLQFELSMKYHDGACDVRATSNQFQGVFSQDIVIQHHDRIVTTQDVGLSVYCQYDLGNRSVTNNVDLAIERIPDGSVESKQQQGGAVGGHSSSSSSSSPLTITGLATTVVRSPNVTMRITNMNGLPVTSATVGDRLALMFEIKEKTSPFGIFVREIVAMDGRQPPLVGVNGSMAALNGTTGQPTMPQVYHHYAGGQLNESILSEATAATPANSIQFLDSEGCPTDANLMGPLVKMDPHGHRLLAPFDAFKFPTSDMVFFRAVVSSCVAECKPAVCPATGGSGTVASPIMQAGGGLPMDLDKAASSAYGGDSGRNSISSLAPSDDENDVIATTRNMQTSSSKQQQPQSTTKQFVLTTSTSTTSTTTTAAPSYSLSSTSAPNHHHNQQQQVAGHHRQQNPTTTTTTTSTMSPQVIITSRSPPTYEVLERTTKLHHQIQNQHSHQQQSDLISGDSLTTVPGFNIDRQQQSTTVSSSELSPSSSSMAPEVDLSRLEPHATINMTNNHNLGRPSPRPLTTTTLGDFNPVASEENSNQAGAQSAAGRPVGAQSHLQPPPAKLDPLTAQERQAILDLLSGHDKSSLLSTSSSSVSTSSPSGSSQTTQSTPAGSSSAALYNDETITSGLMKLYPILDSFRHGNSRSRGLNGQQPEQLSNQQPMSSRQVLNKIRAIISDQFQADQDEVAQSGGRNSSALSSPHSQIAANQLNGEQPQFPPPSRQMFKRSFANNQEFVEFINRTLIDYIIAEELKSLLMTQMLLDDTRNALTSGSGNKGARSLDDDYHQLQQQQRGELMFPLERLNKFYDTMGWPRITSVGVDGHQTQTQMVEPALSFVQVERLVKSQFDNQLASKIQTILKLLSDTKTIDAKQEIKRSKRQVAEENSMISNGYVYMHQPQEGKFTSGHVEMYLTPHYTEPHQRFRRSPLSHQLTDPGDEFEAHHDQVHHQSPEGPKYEMDEMIVQSIKIVDRLQFEDELLMEQQRKHNAASSSNDARSLANSKRDNGKWPSARRKLKLRPGAAKLADQQDGGDLLANEIPQARLGDEPAASDLNNPIDDETLSTAYNAQSNPVRSKLSAFNIVLVALCFIFIQVSMVLACLIDWSQQRKLQRQQQQQRQRMPAPHLLVGH